MTRAHGRGRVRRYAGARAGAALVAALVVASCGERGFPEPENTDGPVTALSGAATVEATKGTPAAEVARCPAVGPAAKVTGGLPDLTLDCLGAGPATRLSALRGPLVLNVWASWCEPCADEVPFLLAAREALGSRVQFLGIDMADKASSAREWLVHMGVPYPSLEDPEGAVRARLRIPGPPVTLFIRSDGTVADVHYGAFRSAGEVAAAVAEHLGVRS